MEAAGTARGRRRLLPVRVRQGRRTSTVTMLRQPALASTGRHNDPRPRPAARSAHGVEGSTPPPGSEGPRPVLSLSNNQQQQQPEPASARVGCWAFSPTPPSLVSIEANASTPAGQFDSDLISDGKVREISAAPVRCHFTSQSREAAPACDHICNMIVILYTHILTTTPHCCHLDSVPGLHST